MKQPTFELKDLTDLRCCALERGDILVCVRTDTGYSNELKNAEIDDIALVLDVKRHRSTLVTVLHRGVVRKRVHGGTAWAKYIP